MWQYLKIIPGYYYIIQADIYIIFSFINVICRQKEDLLQAGSWGILVWGACLCNLHVLAKKCMTYAHVLHVVETLNTASIYQHYWVSGNCSNCNQWHWSQKRNSQQTPSVYCLTWLAKSSRIKILCPIPQDSQIGTSIQSFYELMKETTGKPQGFNLYSWQSPDLSVQWKHREHATRESGCSPKTPKQSLAL